MKSTLRVGLLGYGYASKTFHAPLISGTPGLELAVVSSSDAGKVHSDWPATTVVDTPEKVFSDPNIDLVVIPTPNATHYPLARQALEAGKHVAVDKPFTVTLDEARALKKLADEQNRILSVFHNRRWDSDFLTVKSLLEENTLGEIVYFESHFDRFRPNVQARWREGAEPGSGIWYDLGAHLLDQAVQLFGMPDAIQSDQAMMRPGAKAVDYFHSVLFYPRRRVVLHGTLYAAGDTDRFIIHGEKGSYIKHGLDPQEARLKNGEHLPQPNWGYDEHDGVLTVIHDGIKTDKKQATLAGNYPAYYAALRDAINGKCENPVTATEAIRVMELIELGIQSARELRTIPIPGSIS